MELFLSLEGKYFVTQNQVEDIQGKSGDATSGNELESGRRGLSSNVYRVLSTMSRNADHHLDHMSNSLLAKYFISHLVLVLEVNSNRIWKTQTRCSCSGEHNHLQNNSGTSS